MTALAFDPQVPTRADGRLDLVQFELLERPGVPEPVKRSLGDPHQSSVAEDGELVVLRQYIAEGVGRSDVSAEDRLFLALSFYYPIRNARSVARKLLAHFGSIGSVLAASQYALGELVADAAGLWTYLTSLHTLALSALFEDASAEKVDLGNRGKLEKYLRLALAHQTRESVRLLLLSATNHLLRDELHALGCEGSVTIDPKAILAACIRFQATALIIVHNHPSGDPTPSPEDIDSTRLLARSLPIYGVKLHDHIIVGRFETFSMWSEGLL